MQDLATGDVPDTLAVEDGVTDARSARRQPPLFDQNQQSVTDNRLAAACTGGAGFLPQDLPLASGHHQQGRRDHILQPG
jgi:hypothetical protein